MILERQSMCEVVIDIFLSQVNENIFLFLSCAVSIEIIFATAGNTLVKFSLQNKIFVL